MLEDLLKKKLKKYSMEEQLELLDKRLTELEEGQKRIVSMLRQAFPAPTEMEIEDFLRHCEHNGILVLDEWNRRKELEKAITEI